MRYIFISLFLLISSIAIGQSDLARQHLAILTSDSLAGRGFTEEGQEKAASYIIEQLKKFDVEAGNRDSFKQELSYPVNTFPGSVRFSLENQNTIKIYSAGKDFLFHSASAPLNLSGQIKQIPTDYSFLQNKTQQIFYVEKNAGNAQEIEELTNTFLFDSQGNENLLIIQDSTKWSWFPSSKQSDNVVLYVKEHLPACAEISATNMANFVPDFTSSNVVGKIKGRRSDSIIMFSAHYDHLGQMGNAIFKGANDNASGVAMLLALAQYYGNNQPKFDTYFLFTTAEEVGLLGSYFFIENPPFNLRKIKMLVNLDMVGTGDDGIMVVNGKKQERYFNLLSKLNKNRIAKIKARGEACNSDHCLFDRIDIPTVFIYTLGGKSAYHDIYDNGEDLSLEAFDELHDLIIESLEYY